MLLTQDIVLETALSVDSSRVALAEAGPCCEHHGKQSQERQPTTSTAGGHQRLQQESAGREGAGEQVRLALQSYASTARGSPANGDAGCLLQILARLSQQALQGERPQGSICGLTASLLDQATLPEWLG